VWKCLDRTWAVPGFRIGAGRIYDLACPKEGDKPPEVSNNEQAKRVVAERKQLLRLLLLAGGADEMVDMDMVDRLSEQQ
jgi:hypothetical protein